MLEQNIIMTASDKRLVWWFLISFLVWRTVHTTVVGTNFIYSLNNNCYRYYTLYSLSIFSLAKRSYSQWFPRARSNEFRETVYLSLFISKQCIIKQLLDSDFVISGMIKVSEIKCYQPQPSARLITVTSTLIIPDIAKKTSNNRLL